MTRKGTTADRLAGAPGLRPDATDWARDDDSAEALTHDGASAPRVGRQLHGRHAPPWDIGRPQPAFVRLADQGRLTGRLLDAGCGTGENALLAASRGADVTGIDVAPTAIAQARAKASERGLTARFEVADALDLGRVSLTVDTGGRCSSRSHLPDGLLQQPAHPRAAERPAACTGTPAWTPSSVSAMSDVTADLTGITHSGQVGDRVLQAVAASAA
jgi:SAM-dependent methyltransferase